MKELNKKVFITIFTILSLFLVSCVSIYNVRTYKKEYDNVRRNLTLFDDKKDNRFERRVNDGIVVNPKDHKIDDMMIMDYEVYTVILNDGKIDKIINHSDNDEFDVEDIANTIISKNKGVHIGNLYGNGYSYNYGDDSIVIINTKNINDKLFITLISSIILLVVGEVLIYLVSRFITKQITKPALEAFNKQKDFIADASHELKTPLAVIMASSDELNSDNKKNEKYVSNIKYEADRMNTLIRSLLDLSKLENGVLIGTYKEENISKIIERISLTFEGVAFEKNVLIDSDIEKDIMLNCSKEEIEKLISIILDNAIKHSYSNSTIFIRVCKEKNNINIEVINSGDPIKDGDEEKIFERFYRGDKSRNRDANRYGLGLAIAKNIVINHKGVIKAYSKDGKTTFKIILKK